MKTEDYQRQCKTDNIKILAEAAVQIPGKSCQFYKDRRHKDDDRQTDAVDQSCFEQPFCTAADSLKKIKRNIDYSRCMDQTCRQNKKEIPYHLSFTYVFKCKEEKAHCQHLSDLVQRCKILTRQKKKQDTICNHCRLLIHSCEKKGKSDKSDHCKQEQGIVGNHI